MLNLFIIILLSFLSLIIGILLSKIRLNVLKQFFLILTVIIVIIGLSAYELIALYFNSFNELIFYPTSFLTILLITFYLVANSRIILNKHFVASAVTTLTVISLFIAQAYPTVQYSIGQVVNPIPSTEPIFQYYAEELALDNSSFPSPNVVLNPRLDNYTAMSYLYMTKFLNYLHEFNDSSKEILIFLDNGNVNYAKELYSISTSLYSNLSSSYNILLYYLRLLAPYSPSSPFIRTEKIATAYYTNMAGEMSEINSIMGLIDKLPNTSNIPVSIIVNQRELPINSSVSIKGVLKPEILSGKINGTVLVKYLNFTELIPVKQGEFAFNLTVSQYVSHVNVLVGYLGNFHYLPNFTTFTFYTTSMKTVLNASSYPDFVFPGENLTIVGNVNGGERILKVNFSNFTKEYNVSNNFTISFPLPSNITNGTHYVIVTVLPNGNFSPAKTKVYFSVRLYHANLSAITSSTWLIPFPQRVVGYLSYQGIPLNNTRIFVFVGNQRYSSITHGGYFEVEIKPKLTTIYGEQVIYVESDPSGIYYRQVIELHTVEYNTIFPIFVASIFTSFLIYLSLTKKTKKDKKFKLLEMKME
ncbi:hypothetical protein [Acidianus sp. RZ1]|uniref:hypothetical protein n=1 Tax=Acidianus sp. RZ1 TaxID=1540082 RepID=UPI0014916977|nr:hypothetical protein [Acidianus sp. RZ1]NON61717.1 hypothetical protein [Acidianus sp. RZ1]